MHCSRWVQREAEREQHVSADFFRASVPHLKLISFVFVPSGWPTCPEPLGVKTVYSLISSPYVKAAFVSVSVCTV